ncbi:hypothetical protein BAUCODRAFT_517980 [Baudoinia panamericana UAMH 10762]|uniref:Uncharacterized protein n=1 Tax=Baudoinia panamericana (strain UAMH 10762) TaxID=717646 RepID=M2MHL8_BAUPA|nr:uncharacterized protein BAUCODRAFT_517980 [Baudoinia panamericana UAMH 10762]EMC96111.1 hypothetical protein BAUCODRAFT_517980 [Baudoinia panamericana UAMH 10762]
MFATAIPSVHDDFPREKNVVRLNIDYGSGQLKAALQYICKGERACQSKIISVPWDEGCSVLEQKIVPFGDGSIIRGDDVDLFVDKEPERSGEVIELWKLCLCPEYQDMDAARRVWSALGAKHGDMGAIRDSYRAQSELDQGQNLALAQNVEPLGGGAGNVERRLGYYRR